MILVPLLSFAQTCIPAVVPFGACTTETQLYDARVKCESRPNYQNSTEAYTIAVCADYKTCKDGHDKFIADTNAYNQCVQEKADLEAKNKAAQDEANRILNEKKVYDDAVYQNCQKKLGGNFYVDADYQCKCNEGTELFEGTCRTRTSICQSWYGPGAISKRNDATECVCKEGYLMRDKRCEFLPVPAGTPPIQNVVQPKPNPTPAPVQKKIENKETKDVIVITNTTTSTTTPFVEHTTTEPIIAAPVEKEEMKKIGIIRRIWFKILSLW